MRCGVRAVLRILFCTVLCWDVLWFWIVFEIPVWDLGFALRIAGLKG